MGLEDSLSSITNVTLEWPSWGEIWRNLTLRAGYNTATVVVGTFLLGVAAGIVGTFTLLRKRALMGDALSHATLPGIALAFLLAVGSGFEGKNLSVLLPGAAVTGVLGVVTIHLIVRHTRLAEDAAIGIVLSVFFGFGIVLLSLIQSLGIGNQGGLNTFIYGQTAAMSPTDGLVMGGAAFVAIVSAILFLKEFALVCFNDEFAEVQGWPVGFIDLVMMTLVVAVTVIGLQAVGIILVIAFLIIPPATARFWTERLWVMVILSGVIGGLSGYLGSVASALLPRMPAGSVIVLTAGAMFLVSLLFAPARGLVADGIRRLRLTLKIAEDHLLRAVDEIGTQGRREGGEDTLPRVVTVSDLLQLRKWSVLSLWFLIRWLRARDFLEQRADRLSLTRRGRAEAARVKRNRELWEQYLITHADVAASHVDFSADLVEHVLSPELIAEIEAALKNRVGETA